MHYYQHHIGDYRRDTIHLSLLEHGAYRQLMDCYYLAESPLPTEPEALFRKLVARTEEEREAVRIVLAEFFRLTPEGWIHTRCDREIESFRAKVDQARENGRRGGRPVAGKKTATAEEKIPPAAEEIPPAQEKAGPDIAAFLDKTERDNSGLLKITDPVFLGFLRKTNPVFAGFSEITDPVISGLSEKTQPKANHEPLTINQEPLTNNHGRKEHARELPPLAGCRLPEDWTLPEEWRQWAAESPRNLSLQKIDEEATWFKNYWLKCEGARAYKWDWRATWRNWIEKVPPSRRQEKFDPLAYVNGQYPREDEGNVIEHS